MNMTHNENIRIFSNIAHHFELESEYIEIIGPSAQTYIVEFSSKKFSSFICKWSKSKKGKKIVYGPMNKNKQFWHKKDKRVKKKDKTKITCYNYGKKCHFAHECTESKNLLSHSISKYETYVSIIVLLTESYPM